MIDREIEYLKQHIKDLYKRDWELLTTEEQSLIKEFVDVSLQNDFSVQQICDCMQCLPACDIMLIISLFPDNMTRELDKTMIDMYTTNFKNLVDGKPHDTKFVSCSKYKTNILAGKISRFITRNELFFIISGLKENPIVLFMDKPCENKYVIELQKYHNERKIVKERNKEYFLVKELRPVLLKDCVARANNLVNSANIL